MKPNYVLRPNKKVFVGYSTIKTALGLAILFFPLAILAFVTRFGAYGWLALLLYAAFVGFAYIQKSIKFKKTSVEFYDTQIVMRTGSLVSDAQKTLNITNITSVHTYNPWIENTLFSTGMLSIQAAGSSGTEVHIKHINNCEKNLQYVISLMKNNGFSLQKQTHLQQEQPSKLAVAIGFIPWIAILGTASLIGLGVGIILITQTVLILLALLILGAILWTVTIVKFKDAMRREYFVYDDCVEYQEGYLNKHHAILPAEKISECSNSQGLIDRIIGTSNVEVQTIQGSTYFSHMPNGEKLEEAIDSIAAKKELASEKKETTQPTVAKRTIDSSFTASYKPDVKRTLALPAIGVLIILIGLTIGSLFMSAEAIILAVFGGGWALFIIFATVIGNIIKVLRTTYTIKEQGLHETYSLFSRKTQELSDEKIVFVRVTTSLLDRVMNVTNIEFFSISGTSIEFKHIRDYHELLSEVTKKYGFESQQHAEIQTQYRIVHELKSTLPSTLLSTLAIILGSIIAGYLTSLDSGSQIGLYIGLGVLGFVWLLRVIGFIQSILSYKQSKLTLYQEHLEYTKGWLHKQHDYMRLEHLQHISTTAYRLTNVGSIHISSGGSSLVDENNQQRFVATGIHAKYIPKVYELLDELDSMYLGNTNGFSDVQIHKKPQKRNVVLAWIWLPIVIPFATYTLSKHRYEFESQRILTYKGIWNKQKNSYLYVNVDHLGVKKGLLNKLLGNETIQVYTLGGGSADVSLLNLDNGEEIESEIEAKYL